MCCAVEQSTENFSLKEQTIFSDIATHLQKNLTVLRSDSQYNASLLPKCIEFENGLITFFDEILVSTYVICMYSNVEDIMLHKISYLIFNNC